MSMIDVTAKPEVYREATARGYIALRPRTIKLIKERKVEKGDPLNTAKIAGVLAAKNTSLIIPLCHPIPLTHVAINTNVVRDSEVEVEATVKTRGQTGVEMEALAAVTVALMTVWDMTKKYEKDARGQYPHTVIKDLRVISKIKGSG